MRILSVFGDDHPLVAALVDLGCPLSVVSLWELPPPGEPALYFGDAFEQIKRPVAFAKLRAHLARAGIPYVMWNRDAPWDCSIKPWRRWMLQLARPVDLHLAHSLQSSATFGNPVVYFPNAANPESYNLGHRTLESLRPPAGYQFDVTFVGTINPGFSRTRARLDFLQALVPRLQAQNISCRLFDTSLGSPLKAADQVEIIQASRVNLSVGAVCDSPVPSWGMPERCFGVAACGGFLLCDHRKHATETFPPGAWSEFLDLNDCVRRVQEHLADFDATRRKAELLHADVMARHTYRHRAQQLLQLARDWRQAAVTLRPQASTI